MTHAPFLSVVIPTRNRRESLLRLLASLERQTVPAGSFEVVVVDDGGTDGTASALEALDAPFPLRLVPGAGDGPAVARNAGARAAAHGLVVFLDDDVEASPGLLAAHAAAHSDGAERAVVGPYFPSHRPTRDPFRILSRNWWEETFAEMARPGHRTGYRDLLSGNLSAPREAFLRWGGFDEGFRGVRCEDWELGARLMALGVPIVFRADAHAVHHEADTLTLRRALRDAHREGQGFARLDRLHPSLAAERGPDGPLRNGRIKRLVHDAAARGDALRDTGAWLASLSLGPMGILRLRRSWRHLYGLLHLYAFWRGYHEPLPGGTGDRHASSPALAAAVAPDDAIAELDLADGLDAAAGALERLNAAAVRLSWRGRPLGTIEPSSGAERLRARHLRPLLAGVLSEPLTQVLLEDESLRHHPGA